MTGSHDLSGQWDGHFDYSAGFGPSTAFLATIRQSGGHFTEQVIEPDLYSRAAPAEAMIEGVVAGQSVDFTKRYTHASFGYENPVDYVGQLSEDGNRISGVWSLLDLNGTFEMTREAEAAVGEERAATDEVSIGAAR